MVRSSVITATQRGRLNETFAPASKSLKGKLAIARGFPRARRHGEEGQGKLW